MNLKTISTAVALLAAALSTTANATGYEPGDGRYLSEETLQMFADRLSAPVSPQAAAAEKFFDEQNRLKHGSIDE